MIIKHPVIKDKYAVLFFPIFLEIKGANQRKDKNGKLYAVKNNPPKSSKFGKFWEYIGPIVQK
jgi:hypothetical protein